MADKLSNSLSDAIAKIIQIKSSGSLHDITSSGIYYLTGNVTDKPVANGGLYIVSVYNSQLIVGKYISMSNDDYNIIKNGSTYYTYNAGKTYYDISGTTSNTGAIEIPSGLRGYTFVGGHLTTGGPGFVVRRDESYFTVFNNNGSPMGNTTVAFKALFL